MISKSHSQVGTSTTNLWLLVDAQISQVNLQINSTFHHHASPQLVLGHFLLEAVLVKACRVKVIAAGGDADVADGVAALVQIVLELAARGHKVEGGAARGRSRLGLRALVEQQLGDGLVAVGDGPHQRGPAVAVLDVDMGASVQQDGDNLLMAEAGGVNQRGSAVGVRGVDVDKGLGIAGDEALDGEGVAVGGGEVERVLQNVALFLVRQAVVLDDRVLLPLVHAVVLKARLLLEHLVEAAVAIRERGVGVGWAVERQVEVEGLGGERCRYELGLACGWGTWSAHDTQQDGGNAPCQASYISVSLASCGVERRSSSERGRSSGSWRGGAASWPPFSSVDAMVVVHGLEKPVWLLAITAHALRP